MDIPPIASQFSSLNPSESPVVSKLYDLWTNWYKAASKGSHQVSYDTDKLINFLKDNKNLLENMTKNTPSPFGPEFHESFSDLYSKTTNDLESWKKEGCNPASSSELSEWVGDVYKWCKAADSSTF